MGEVNYELKHPFKYAYKDDMQEASFITLTAPTYRHVDKVTPIKQAFMAAIKQATEGISEEDSKIVQADTEEASEISAHDAIQVLFQWSGDLTSVMEKAAALFKSGVAQIDGETPFNKGLLEKMSMVDFEGMVGCYLANFIVPSLTDGQ